MWPVKARPMAMSGAACEQMRMALLEREPVARSWATTSASTSAMMDERAVARRSWSWAMVSPRVEGITLACCWGVSGRMVGKWVLRVVGDDGDGWWKKEVGPNHSLCTFLCISFGTFSIFVFDEKRTDEY